MSGSSRVHGCSEITASLEELSNSPHELKWEYFHLALHISEERGDFYAGFLCFLYDSQIADVMSER